MTRDDLSDEELMSRFGSVLKTEADRYEPVGDSLALIRERVPATRGRTAGRWLAPLAAAAVVIAVASAVVLYPRHDDNAGSAPGTSNGSVLPTPTSSSSPSVSTPAPSGSAQPPVSPSGTPSGNQGGGTTTVGCVSAGRTGYAYYASDLNGHGPRLYRVMTPLTCHYGVEQVFAVPAGKDPDYTSLWPAGTTVTSVTRNGATLTVDLSDFPQTDAAGEQAAVQQLVYTVTANKPAITSVRLLVDGAAPSGNLDWSQPVRRAPALDTLSNVWILNPGMGSSHTSPVTVDIYGTGYEGQVPLKVFKDGVEVASGAVTTQMGAFASASTTFDLPPGTYELRAYNDNAQDGSLELWDTKTFTVT